jgi:hypothetical protein
MPLLEVDSHTTLIFLHPLHLVIIIILTTGVPQFLLQLLLQLQCNPPLQFNFITHIISLIKLDLEALKYNNSNNRA